MNKNLKTQSRPRFAGFGDFVLAHREQILRSWITAVDQNPKISASDSLTFAQLLDHLPELCAELGALLNQPDAESVKREANDDAKAHGWKRWRQGYKLEELIREICLVRCDFVYNWLPVFAAANPQFDTDAQNDARRVVEHFFDEVIIRATVQFVDEQQQLADQIRAELLSGSKATRAMKAEFGRLASHTLREPLGPLLYALHLLLNEESLSPRGIEMLQVMERGVKEEGRAIEELLRLAESL